MFLEHEEFSMLHGTVEDYSRVLDFKEGAVRRTLI